MYNNKYLVELQDLGTQLAVLRRKIDRDERNQQLRQEWRELYLRYFEIEKKYKSVKDQQTLEKTLGEFF